MPAIFFLTLPTPEEPGTGAEAWSPAEQADVSGYSGHLSFDGSFDQFGFVPRRTYSGTAETHNAPRIASEVSVGHGRLLATESRPRADAQPE